MVEQGYHGKTVFNRLPAKLNVIIEDWSEYNENSTQFTDELFLKMCTNMEYKPSNRQLCQLGMYRVLHNNTWNN